MAAIALSQTAHVACISLLSSVITARTANDIFDLALHTLSPNLMLDVITHQTHIVSVHQRPL